MRNLTIQEKLCSSAKNLPIQRNERRIGDETRYRRREGDDAKFRSAPILSEIN